MVPSTASSVRNRAIDSGMFGEWKRRYQGIEESLHTDQYITSFGNVNEWTAGSYSPLNVGSALCIDMQANLVSVCMEVGMFLECRRRLWKMVIFCCALHTHMPIPRGAFPIRRRECKPSEDSSNPPSPNLHERVLFWLKVDHQQQSTCDAVLISSRPKA